eukprot:CAMPEP_0197696756 /NCGR_PEP_ID=MMETSP1338-20131121/117077_1 /TAXON_ID=43686 ORGANISM="Pelagodinium beii, Strain RCC1491" /NCGR_SAMPLE_ID=MMETSP1338 /ASSEMBLY_ACC=CAM_ASM_000754 /LENGTH=113 /DNA_ID=CAMNT_0043279925 /DNA_START=98 /DNA_END=439 /DNA_ORIENTATION=+
MELVQLVMCHPNFFVKVSCQRLVDAEEKHFPMHRRSFLFGLFFGFHFVALNDFQQATLLPNSPIQLVRFPSLHLQEHPCPECKEAKDDDDDKDDAWWMFEPVAVIKQCQKNLP